MMSSGLVVALVVLSAIASSVRCCCARRTDSLTAGIVTTILEKGENTRAWRVMVVSSSLIVGIYQSVENKQYEV